MAKNEQTNSAGWEARMAVRLGVICLFLFAQQQRGKLYPSGREATKV